MCPALFRRQALARHTSPLREKTTNALTASLMDHGHSIRALSYKTECKSLIPDPAIQLLCPSGPKLLFDRHEGDDVQHGQEPSHTFANIPSIL